MNIRRVLFAMLLLLLGLTLACNNSELENANKSPTPEDPATRAARLEQEFQIEGNYDNKLRAEARQVATEFIKAKLPKWSIKGVASQPYQANLFWVDVDVEKDGRTVVVSLETRKFFPESGEPYWKAFPLRKTLESRLHDMNDADVLRQLNEAQRELDELKNPREEPEP